MEAEFGEALHIIPDGKGKLIIYPDNLSMNGLVRDYHTLRVKLQLMVSNSQEDILSKQP